MYLQKIYKLENRISLQLAYIGVEDLISLIHGGFNQHLSRIKVSIWRFIAEGDSFLLNDAHAELVCRLSEIASFPWRCHMNNRHRGLP